MGDLSAIFLLYQQYNYVLKTLNKIKPHSPKEYKPTEHQFLYLMIASLF